jgi:transposase
MALLGAALGAATVAILHVENGDPAGYANARCYQRALGLNLVERSSGQQKGPLHISKRGRGRSRRWLYMATLRLLPQPGVAEWYARKVARDGGRKSRALTAVLRKVAAGLWHCARTGEVFDPQRLFAPGPPRRGTKRRADGAAPEGPGGPDRAG